jgi:hypothetical protein
LIDRSDRRGKIEGRYLGELEGEGGEWKKMEKKSDERMKCKRWENEKEEKRG